MLKKLVSYPTITPKECGIYEYIKDFLSDFKALEFEKEGIKIYFYIRNLGIVKRICVLGDILM